MAEEKIIQIISTREAGELALTDEGNIYRLHLLYGGDKGSDVVYFKDEIHLIPIKIIKTDG